MFPCLQASDLQQKYTQLSHEMRKRDKAYSALQEKFNNLVSGKEKTVKPFMESHGVRIRSRISMCLQKMLWLHCYTWCVCCCAITLLLYLSTPCNAAHTETAEACNMADG